MMGRIGSGVRAFTRTGSLVYICVGLAACGDDDGSSSPREPGASTTDAGDDTDGPDASRPEGDASEPSGGGDGVSEVIDSSGGSITSADGVFTLVVPEGALEEATEFTIAVVPESEWSDGVRDLDPVFAVYDVQPDGLEFRVPAELRFQWSSAPAELRLDDEGIAIPALVYSESASGDLEEVAPLGFHYTEDGDGLLVSAEVEHLSSKLLSATNRGCTLSVAAPTGRSYVGSSWQASAFAFRCTGDAADAIQSVAPIAGSSETRVVGVAFAGTAEGDRFLTSLSDTWWWPGASSEISGTSSVELARPTWSCLAEGEALISAGAIITRDTGRVAVTREIGPVECVECELEQQDCKNLELLDLNECACVCPHDQSYECSPGKRFDADACACTCIQTSCPNENQALNPETCECDCTLEDSDCGPYQRVNRETCECECSQLQQCSGATPDWNADTCQCECQLQANDCPSPKVPWEGRCECACQEAVDGMWQCPSESQFVYRDEDSCECVCAEETGRAWCADGGYGFSTETCDCVCELTEQDCSGNFTLDAEACACVCPEQGPHRECQGDAIFDEEACECVCDLEEPCPPDFGRNPDSCRCECILDQEASCLPGQILNQDTCTCGCAISNEDCPAYKQLNPSNCECECSQLQNCPEAFPVWDEDTCQCVCELAAEDCTGETPFFLASRCACVPHIFYYLAGTVVSLTGTCDDADDQATITNVTDSGFTLEGLTGNTTPIPMTIQSNGRTAVGTNVRQFGQLGHTLTITIDSDATPEAGSGNLTAVSSSGSCACSVEWGN